MGAHNIATTGYGQTAKAAYERACRIAQFEDGHDPYNGTISTTEGCIVKPLGQGKFTQAAIRRWEELALDGTEKWGPVWALELPRSHAKGQARGVRAYLFVGWAAS